VRFDYDSLRVKANGNELGLFVSSFPSAGEKFGEVAPFTLVVRDLSKNILHPDTRFDSGILAGLDEGVHDGCAISGSVIPTGLLILLCVNRPISRTGGSEKMPPCVKRAVLRTRETVMGPPQTKKAKR